MKTAVVLHHCTLLLVSHGWLIFIASVRLLKVCAGHVKRDRDVRDYFLNLLLSTNSFVILKCMFVRVYCFLNWAFSSRVGVITVSVCVHLVVVFCNYFLGGVCFPDPLKLRFVSYFCYRLPNGLFLSLHQWTYLFPVQCRFAAAVVIHGKVECNESHTCVSRR